MVVKLTDTLIRNAIADQGRVKKLSESGMQLHVHPDGKKYWRLEYRFGGKRKMLSLGVYPTKSLANARRDRDAAKNLLRDGVDPSAARQAKKRQTRIDVANTLDAVAEEWLTKLSRDAIAGGTRRRSKATVEKIKWAIGHARRKLGRRPVVEIKPLEILDEVLRPLERSDRLEAAKRVRANLERLFDYAIVTGRCETNPATSLKGALTSPVAKPRAAIVERAKVGELVRAIAGYSGNIETRIALQLLMLTAVRPGEMRAAEWVDFDLVAGEWIIPAEKMKMRRDHRIPLPKQALELLKNLEEMTGGGRYPFPSVRGRGRCMSEVTMGAALARMGFSKEEVVAHGMRSTFSTLAHESGKWRSEVVEAALAHVEGGVKGIYQRSDFWRERISLMRWYADLLDELREGGQILKITNSSKVAMSNGRK